MTIRILLYILPIVAGVSLTGPYHVHYHPSGHKHDHDKEECATSQAWPLSNFLPANKQVLLLYPAGKVIDRPVKYAIATTVDKCIEIDGGDYGAVVLLPDVTSEVLLKECPHLIQIPLWDHEAHDELKAISISLNSEIKRDGANLRIAAEEMVRIQLARNIKRPLNKRTIGVLAIDATYEAGRIAPALSFQTKNSIMVQKTVDLLFFSVVQNGKFECIYNLFEDEGWGAAVNAQYKRRNPAASDKFLGMGYYRMNQAQLVVDMKRNFAQSVLYLESYGAEMIVGDNGFLIYYQKDCIAITTKALTLLSSLAALPLVQMYESEPNTPNLALILTVNTESLESLMNGVVLIVGFPATFEWQKHFAVRDWSEIEPFDTPLKNGEPFVQSAVVEQLRIWFKDENNFKRGEYYAILLESPDMPQFRNDIVSITAEIEKTSFKVFGPAVMANWVLDGFNRADLMLDIENNRRKQARSC